MTQFVPNEKKPVIIRTIKNVFSSSKSKIKDITHKSTKNIIEDIVKKKYK